MERMHKRINWTPTPRGWRSKLWTKLQSNESLHYDSDSLHISPSCSAALLFVLLYTFTKTLRLWKIRFWFSDTSGTLCVICVSTTISGWPCHISFGRDHKCYVVSSTANVGLSWWFFMVRFTSGGRHATLYACRCVSLSVCVLLSSSLTVPDSPRTREW